VIIREVFWITGPWQGRLGIVPRPRGAEWLDDETRAWREAGIDVIVSLLEPAEEAELALAGESTASAASGLEFRSFPIPDRSVPSSREAVAQLADHIVNALHAGKNVALHCRQGIGRSALIAAAALISGGQDAETAIKTIRRSRGLEVPETSAQRQWISDFSSWLADKRAAQPEAPADALRRRLAAELGGPVRGLKMVLLPRFPR
jgi:protein-tyrosine phosphatase